MAVAMAKETNEKVPVSIGIERGDRQKLADLLSSALADTYVLYAKIQGFHWNVRGPNFYGIHKMTEEQYEDLHGAIDEVAERIRAVGFLAPTTLSRFVASATVKEGEMTDDAPAMLEILVKDHQTVVKSLRDAVEEAEKVNDVFTADMLTARIGTHEKFAWMLRSQLGKA